MFARPPFQSATKVSLAARVATVAAKSAPDTFENDVVSDQARTRGRRAPREPNYKQGVLRLGFGEILQVVVKNFSSVGARVEFFRHVTLTDDVILSVPLLISNQKARVVWQKEGSAGLKFEQHQDK